METAKKRGAQKTREAILAAAATRFSQRSYEAVGLREIAEAAGVNVALINRYFGSKSQLYALAVTPGLSLQPVLAQGVEGFPPLMRELMMKKEHLNDGFDPLLAVILSAGSEEVKPATKAAFDELIAELAALLPGQGTEQRAAMVIALLFGFDALRRIVGVEALSPGGADDAAALLEQMLERLVDGG